MLACSDKAGMKWFKHREYKTGSSWALFRWTFVPSNFIVRLHLFKTPWCSVVLHWINKPDEEPYLHDHPVSFFSLILKGWYREQRQKDHHYRHGGYGTEHCSGVRKWFNWIKATPGDRHTITNLPPKGALTLCFMGPKTREWGYHTPEGWVHWKAYNAETYGKTQ